jgi:RNA-directed DNA polymerase
MTLRAVFAPLLRALAGGRSPAPGPPDKGDAILSGNEWPDLLAELGLPPNAFREVLAAGSLHTHFHYRRFTRPKKDGGKREIAEPDCKLKRIQQAIIARWFAVEEPHPAAVAYRRKKSIADHVWPHAGAEVLVTADVQDFFPSTSAGRVEDWWRERVGDNAARLLALLTTDRGGLPQGAPTSPGLSNLVNRELDQRLFWRAAAAGARYTRYCDDMVFSWRWGAGPPSDFESGVRATLHEFGYRLHPTKGWRIHHRRDEPEIAGVILDRHGDVRLPDALRQAMRRLAGSRDPHELQRLAGYRGYEAMVRKRPRR